MAVDTKQKRMAAMNLSCPWRGLQIVPNVAVPQGEIQAALYMYSGINAAAASGGSTTVHDAIFFKRRGRPMVNTHTA